MAVTYDSSSTANDPTIYINGVAQPLTEVDTPIGTLVDNSDAYIIGNRTAQDRTFDGLIDDVRMTTIEFFRPKRSHCCPRGNSLALEPARSR